MDKPRWDETRVGDKVKGGLCCPAVAGYANDINHPARPRLSPTVQRRQRPTVQNLFDSTTIGALPCDHLAIASTHDSSSRYLRQGEIARRSTISLDPFRTAGIGSALDPADRMCARSRRSPLASRLRAIAEIARDEEISRAEGEYRVKCRLFADLRVNFKIYFRFRSIVFLTYFNIFTR